MFERLLPARRGQLALRGPRDLFDAFDEFFGSALGNAPAVMSEGWRNFPSMDLSETDEAILVKAELPGMNAEDVDLSIENGHLVIKGEKKMESEENQENFHRIERSYGSFTRAVRLPSAVNEAEVKADFKRGVLTIRLPKADEARRRRIEIEAGAE